MISLKNMISLQVFCGAEVFGSPSSKAKNGKKKINENAFNTATEALVSARKKELSSRLCWIALCINAARLCEVLCAHKNDLSTLQPEVKNQSTGNTQCHTVTHCFAAGFMILAGHNASKMQLYSFRS